MRRFKRYICLVGLLALLAAALTGDVYKRQV